MDSVSPPLRFEDDTLQNDCCGHCHRKPYCRLAPVQKSYSPAAWNGARLDGAVLFCVRMDLPRTDKEFIERFLRTSSAQRHPIHGPSRCSGTLLTAGIALISFVLYAFVENPDPNFSIMNNVLGKSLGIFLASSFFGIAGLIATFIVADKLTNIVPIRIAKGILRNISRNALVVLAVHWWILLVLRIIFKSELDKPGTAFLSTLIVTVGITITIPNKPYHPRPTCD